MPNDVVIHIVDDELAVRQSLAFLVSAAGYAVRVHEAPMAFLEGCPYPLGHCLITDLRMPGLDGIALLQRMKDCGPPMPTIVITGHGDVPMAVAAMKEGAHDFIEKPFEDSVLIEAIERVVEQSSSAWTQNREQDAIMARFQSLSERERQVLAGIVSGKANKTIAHEHDLSPRTVEVYRANVMAKMQSKTLPELVRMTLAAGIPIKI
jgi:two-component system response regulator FixJ